MKTIQILILLTLVQIVSASEIRRSDADYFLRSFYAVNRQNPADTAEIEKSEIKIQSIRSPHQKFIFQTLDNRERLIDNSITEILPNRSEFVRYLAKFDKLGVIGLNVIFDHRGDFSRVNSEGKSTNNFPNTNLLIGFHYAKKIRKTQFGIDAKWIRAKVLGDRIGHGYVHNFGVRQNFRRDFSIGMAIRNLSNGLSFADELVFDQMRNQINFDLAKKFRFENFDGVFDFVIFPPFVDGFRGSGSISLSYRNFTTTIGYFNDSIMRTVETENVIDGEIGAIDQRWDRKGITIGLEIEIGNSVISIEALPADRPKTPEVQSDKNGRKSVFSITQRF